MSKIIDLEERIEELNEFISYFKDTPDPREGWRLSFTLAEVLLIVFCAQLNGFESFSEYVSYGKSKLDFLRRFLAFKNGCPSRVTFHRVLATLHPETLELLLVKWMRRIIHSDPLGTVAIDGKTHCGDQDDALKTHLVAAFATNVGVILGQEKVAHKSNEITAIPSLLNKIYIKNQIVTIDAMGCQKAIAEKIVEKEAHYILALKENHKTFYDEVVLYFKDPMNEAKTAESLEKSRGRVEHRKCSVTSTIGWFEDKNKWRNLKSIVKLETMRHMKGKESHDVRYFITDLTDDPEPLLNYIRAHWGIENNLHWMLDVVFKEDDRVLWNDNVIQNEAIIRRCALNVLRSYKTKYNDKTALKTIRKLLMGDNNMMEKILREF